MSSSDFKSNTKWPCVFAPVQTHCVLERKKQKNSKWKKMENVRNTKRRKRSLNREYTREEEWDDVEKCGITRVRSTNGDEDEEYMHVCVFMYAVLLKCRESLTALAPSGNPLHPRHLRRRLGTVYSLLRYLEHDSRIAACLYKAPKFNHLPGQPTKDCGRGRRKHAGDDEEERDEELMCWLWVKHHRIVLGIAKRSWCKSLAVDSAVNHKKKCDNIQS